MTSTGILIDPKNPAEALGCYGILCLDHLLEKAICRSRFVPGRMEKCLDGEFRSYVFEFEHTDGYWDRFLSRCCGMLTTSDAEGLYLAENRAMVLRLDWQESLRPAGQTTKRSTLWLPGPDKEFSPENVFKTQHDALRKLVSRGSERRYLFSRAGSGRPNALTGYNPLNARGFLDAGGVFENKKAALYASEWFCIIALQGLRHYFAGLREQGQFISYHVWKEWLPGCAAFAAMTGCHSSCEEYRSELISKGRNKLIARLATRA
jgi:hypothetical protein